MTLSSRRAHVALGLSLGTLLLGACDVTYLERPIEDRDGVQTVPPPDATVGSNGTGGGGGAGGAAGSGGAGGGGAECTLDSDCFDANVCTVNRCDGGSCVASSAADDGDGCTADACDLDTGDITNTPIVAEADADPCTLDVCDPATGTTNVASIVLFSEDFADNSQGWTLGPEWAIAPASESMGGANLANDPPTDATGSNDEGLAGAVVGGLIENVDHAARYLTSPSIVVTTSGGVDANEVTVLRYNRWLNSDAQSTNTVEVYDGATWNVVGTPITANTDSPTATLSPGLGWTRIEHDITQIVATARASGKAIRVRFGFNRAAGGSDVSGWSLDDVSVVREPSGSCP